MKKLISLIALTLLVNIGFTQVTTTPIILSNNDTVYKTISTMGAGSVTITEGVNEPAMDSSYVNNTIRNIIDELELSIQDSVVIVNRLELLRKKQVKYNLIKELF